MAKTASFTKRALITKANSRIVLATAVSSFIVIFCIVASKSLITQSTYQARVISAKKKAVATLEQDLTAGTELQASYQAFINTPQNILGGSSTGTSGDKDGSNAKIVLDALPSQYDFPALTTSIEKLIKNQGGLSFVSIGGTDDELAQASSQSPNPIPVAMPFEAVVKGSYPAVSNLVNSLEQSIRPIQVQKISLSGNEGDMTATIDAQTFYQPEKSLNITAKVVK